MKPDLAKRIHSSVCNYLDALAKPMKLSRTQALKMIRDTCTLFANFNPNKNEQKQWAELACDYNRALSVGLRKWLEDLPDEEGITFLARIEKAADRTGKKLDELSKCVSLDSSGNPPKLGAADRERVLKRFDELTEGENGLSNGKAYEKIRSELKEAGKEVAIITIRRACDPEEAARHYKPKKFVFFGGTLHE